MKSMFSGLGAKMALATLVVGLTMTSCYDSESVDIVGPAELPDPVYVIYGNVTSSTGGMVSGVEVTLDGTNSQTVQNGAFVYENVAPGRHELRINDDEYLEATRTVYLQTVQDGEACVVVADIVLYDINSQIIEPERQEDATPEQAEEIKTAVEGQITEMLGSVEGLDADNISIDVDPETGDIVVTSSVEVAAGSPGEPVTVQVPNFTGFASTITPDWTKALTDGEIWIASAESALNRNYGLTQIFVDYTLQPAGKASVVGYNLVITMDTETLQFNGISGVVTYQGRFEVSPIVDSHDTHDSHDQHGGGNGAGGGSAQD